MISPGDGRRRRDARASGCTCRATSARRRERYFFDYVKDELIKQYGAKTVRKLGGLQVYTTIDLKKQQEARAAIDGRPRRRRPVVGDRHDRPEQRLHPGDGVVGRLRPVEVQPRRAGPPPAGLDVQGDGADDRAAQGRRPDTTHYISKSPTSSTTRTWGPIDVKTYGGTSARQR